MMEHTRRTPGQLRAMGYSTIAAGATLCSEAGLVVYYTGTRPAFLWAPDWAAQLLRTLPMRGAGEGARFAHRKLLAEVLRACVLRPELQAELVTVCALGGPLRVRAWAEAVAGG